MNIFALMTALTIPAAAFAAYHFVSPYGTVFGFLAALIGAVAGRYIGPILGLVFLLPFKGAVRLGRFLGIGRWTEPLPTRTRRTRDRHPLTLMTRIILPLTLIALLGLSPYSTGQTPESKSVPQAPPDELAQMSAYMAQMVEILISTLNKPEMAAKVASMEKLYLDALMKEGFSRQEAMSILTSPNFFHFKSQ